MSTGKIELSVGAVKIANKYEIFTEEEVDIINNKIPELDKRVGVIEDEIDEINSSLDNNTKELDNKKINRNEPNSITLEMLTTEAKTSMTGGKVAIVGGNSVSLAQFTTEIQKDIGEFKKQNISSTNGFYVFNTGETKILFIDNANYQNVFVQVTEGEQYKINVGVSDDNFPLICFVDNEVDKNVVKKELINNSGSLIRHKDYVVNVPHGATSMLVQGQDAIEPIIINRLTYIPIANKKDIENITNTCKELNKKMFNKIETEKTINLYNMYDEIQTDHTKRISPNFAYNNILFNDNTTAYWSQVCVAKVSVKENTTYTRTHAYLSDANLVNCLITACFDSDDKILEVINSNRDNSNNGNITFTTPVNTEYVLMGLYKNHIPKFMLVEGKFVPNYVKYKNELSDTVKHRTIPKAWENLINEKSQEILKNNKGNEINLAFVSDCHVKSAETEIGVGKLIEQLDKNISLDNVIFGGDLLVQDYVSEEDMCYDVQTYKNVFYPIYNKLLPVQGNHEIYYMVNGERIDISQNRSYSILRNNSQKGCINSDYSNLSYYYDDVDKKIRYISLDWRECDEDVANFVFSTLKDIDNKKDCSEWCVLFIIHYPFMGDSYLHLYRGLKAVKDRTSYLYDYISINSSGVNNYDFSNSVNIVGFLCGHRHFDWIGTKFKFDGEDVGINFFITCADALFDRDDSLQTKMARNSIYNHAINCITINKDDRIVSVYRLGGYKCREGYEWDGVSKQSWSY